MPAPLIRVNYDDLRTMAKIFEREGAALSSVNKRLKRNMNELKAGGWIGKGANKFYAEMNDAVMPSMDKLAHKLIRASLTATTINTIFQRAEDDWKRIFRAVDVAALAAALAASGVPNPAATAAALIGTPDTQGADGLIAKLGKGAKELIAKSPHLRQQLETIAKEGWRIQIGPKGGGSEADLDNKIITIEGGMSTKEVVQTVAHEAAHANYKVPYHAPTAKMTRSEYVKLNLQENLLDEGQAAFNVSVVRDEIIKAGGADIGAEGPKYDAVYKNYKAGKITQQQALNQMANLYGNETTSTTGENYKKYYGQTYEQHWDKYVAPTRRGR